MKLAKLLKRLFHGEKSLLVLDEDTVKKLITSSPLVREFLDAHASTAIAGRMYTQKVHQVDFHFEEEKFVSVTVRLVEDKNKERK